MYGGGNILFLLWVARVGFYYSGFTDISDSDITIIICYFHSL